MKISKLHRERVAEVTRLRETSAEARQAMIWRHQSEREALDAGTGIPELEAAHRDFERKHEEVIARESLAALRGAAKTFGDAPRTATVAIRDAWRAYCRRVEEELGATDPNFLLLPASLLDAGFQDCLGSQAFLDSRAVAGDLGRAIATFGGESLPRTVLALQHLDVAVDEAAHFAAPEADAKASKAITTAATHATVSSRVTIGDAIAGAIAEAVHALANKAA